MTIIIILLGCACFFESIVIWAYHDVLKDKNRRWRTATTALEALENATEREHDYTWRLMPPIERVSGRFGYLCFDAQQQHDGRRIQVATVINNPSIGLLARRLRRAQGRARRAVNVLNQWEKGCKRDMFPLVK